MKYINQLHYPHIPYPTDVGDPADQQWHEGSVKTSGCGLCSACMVVDQLTTQDFSLIECRDLSIAVGANRQIGTNMRILGPAVAEKFGLKYSQSSDVKEAIRALQRGARVIVNVGGDREGYKGVFCYTGHYIVLIAGNAKELCILDPMWEKKRYQALEREGVVRMDGKFLYAAPAVVDKDAENRDPRYHIFER